MLGKCEVRRWCFTVSICWTEGGAGVSEIWFGCWILGKEGKKVGVRKVKMERKVR